MTQIVRPIYYTVVQNERYEDGVFNDLKVGIPSDSSFWLAVDWMVDQVSGDIPFISEEIREVLEKAVEEQRPYTMFEPQAVRIDGQPDNPAYQIVNLIAESNFSLVGELTVFQDFWAMFSKLRPFTAKALEMIGAAIQAVPFYEEYIRPMVSERLELVDADGVVRAYAEFPLGLSEEHYVDEITLLLDFLRASNIDLDIGTGYTVKVSGMNLVPDGLNPDDLRESRTQEDVAVFVSSKDYMALASAMRTMSIFDQQGYTIGDVTFFDKDAKLQINENIASEHFASGALVGLERIYIGDLQLYPSEVQPDGPKVILYNGQRVQGTGFGDLILADASSNNGDIQLNGNGGGDRIVVRGQNANAVVLIDAGAGNDSISGSDGVDAIHGGMGDDKIYGNAGNDQIFDHQGRNVIDGGAGIDLVSFQKRVSYGVTLGPSNTVQEESLGLDTQKTYLAVSSTGLVTAISNVESIYLTDYADTLTFNGSLKNLLNGQPITIDAGGNENGYDFIDLSSLGGGVKVTGSLKDGISIDGGALILKNFEEFKATEYSDNIQILGPSKIEGLGGNDRIVGTAGDDVVDGGAGQDSLSLGGGADTVLFSYGQDRVFKAGGSLAVDYSAATEKLHLAYNGYFDYWKGWGANGIARIDGAMKLQDITFHGSMYGDIIVAGAYYGRLNVYGGGGSDLIEMGNSSGGLIDGGAGNDYLAGSDYRDFIYGGDGDDGVCGEFGNDVIDVGAGNNWFALTRYSYRKGDIAGQVNFDLAAGRVYEWYDLRQYNAGSAYNSYDIVTGVVVGISVGSVYRSGEYNVTVFGSDRAETYQGYAGREKVSMGGGDDTIYLSGAGDVGRGGAGNDILNGTRELATIYPEAKRSTFYGDDGNDTFYLSYDDAHGGSGDDIFNGSYYTNVTGGEGNDRYIGMMCVYFGDSSRIEFQADGRSIKQTINGKIYEDYFVTKVDQVFATENADRIVGSWFREVHGLGGNDEFLITGDKAVLYGDSGKDTFIFMGGKGQAHGGADDDVFQFITGGSAWGEGGSDLYQVSGPTNVGRGIYINSVDNLDRIEIDSAIVDSYSELMSSVVSKKGNSYTFKFDKMVMGVQTNGTDLTADMFGFV